ncbi:hypothetical protein A7A76_20675 [Lysobacter enzymogenes]|nr:hypothetical protein [Lysobacter enzymogenes]
MRVNGTAITSVTFRLYMKGDGGGPNWCTNTLQHCGDALTVGVALNPFADLAITKTNTPAAGPNDQANDTLTPGQNTTYTLVVTNNGPDPVTGATVVDTPGANLNCPGGNTVTVSQPSGNTTSTVSTLTGTGVVLGNLNATQTAALTFTCTVPANAVGNVVNDVRVAAPGVTETNPNNNTANDTDQLPPRVTLAKTTANGTGTNTFGFTLTGVTNTSDSIAVAGAGTVTSTTVHVGTVGTQVTVQESTVPAGWPANPTQVVCTDASSTTPNANIATLSGNTATIPGTAMVAGANITCTFTNQIPPTTLTVTKVSNSGTNTFGFSGSNGIAAHSITTTVAGAPGTAGAQQTLTTAATATTITEDAPPAGWALSAIACTVTPNGGTAAAATGTADLATRTFTLSAADTAAGNAIACTFTNNRLPRLTLLKTVVNDNGGTALDTAWTLTATGPATASGTEGQAAITDASVPVGTYTLSESGGPAGYAATGAFSCVVNGGAPVANNSLTLAMGDVATCTITNDDQPARLTLSKTVARGTAAATAWTLTATGPTNLSGANGSAAVTDAAVTPGTYTLAEANGPVGYDATGPYSCVVNGGAAVVGNTLTLAAGDTAVCTIVNSRPRLRLMKVLPNNRAGNASDQFALTISGPSDGNPTATATVNTTGATTNPTEVAEIQAINAGSSYTLSEAMAPGSAAPITAYIATYSCTNATTGSTTVMPTNQSGTQFQITPAANDDITCRFTNNWRPTALTVTKITQGDNGGGAFNFDIVQSGVTTSQQLTTTQAGAPGATGATVNMTPNTFLRVTETNAATLGYAVTSAFCDSTTSAGVTTRFSATAAAPNLVQVPGNNVTRSGTIACTFTNARRPTLQVTKVSNGGTDTFGFGGSNGAQSYPDIATTAAGAPGTPGPVQALTAVGAATNVSEDVPPAGWVLVGAACTVTPNGGTAAPAQGQFDAATRTVALTAQDTAAGNAIACTFTNQRQSSLQLAKAWAAGSIAGDQVTIGATTGGTNNTASFGATAPTAADSGTPVAVDVGDIVTLPAETGANLANYTTTVQCTGGHTLSGTDGQQSNTLTINSSAAAVCTYTNTPRTATLQLAKAWAAGSTAGHQVSIGATTGGTNNTAAFDATAPNAANSGAAVVVTIGDTITLPAEAGTNAANYSTTLACTGGHTLSGTNGQQANTLTITSANAAVCTYTNTLRTTDLSITKTNTPAAGSSDQADDTVVAGTNTTYRVVVTNHAATDVTGAVVRDTPQAGLNCPAGNAVTCTGAACPGTAITVGDLASGVTLGLLAAGATATLEFSCTVQ